MVKMTARNVVLFILMPMLTSAVVAITFTSNEAVSIAPPTEGKLYWYYNAEPEGESHRVLIYCEDTERSASGLWSSRLEDCTWNVIAANEAGETLSSNGPLPLPRRGDVNCDGAVDTTDARLIQRHAVGALQTLNCAMPHEDKSNGIIRRAARAVETERQTISPRARWTQLDAMR